MIMWPKVFTNPDIVYSQDEAGYVSAVADGLCGWACCMMGATPPPDFGKGMVKIAQRTKQSSSPDSLMALADKLQS